MAITSASLANSHRSTLQRHRRGTGEYRESKHTDTVGAIARVEGNSRIIKFICTYVLVGFHYMPQLTGSHIDFGSMKLQKYGLPQSYEGINILILYQPRQNVYFQQKMFRTDFTLSAHVRLIFTTATLSIFSLNRHAGERGQQRTCVSPQDFGRLIGLLVEMA